MKVAYIVSSSYSGSTLLSFLLNAHPAIGTISEFDMVEDIVKDPDFPCSCGREIRHCPFFIELTALLKGRGVAFEIDNMDMMLKLHDNPRVHRLLCERLPRFQSNTLERFRDWLVNGIPRFRRERKRIHTRSDVFMQAIVELQGATVFLDATKNPYRMSFLNERHDVRALYLYKNGIAGVYSFVKNTAKAGAPISVARASHRWFTEQLTISRILKLMDPEHVLQLSYSDLCTATSKSLDAIYELLGISPTPLANYAEMPHHIVGNVMRMGNFSEIRESTDWKEKMSPSDLDVYRSVFEHYEARLRDANPQLLSAIWR